MFARDDEGVVFVAFDFFGADEAEDEVVGVEEVVLDDPGVVVLDTCDCWTDWADVAFGSDLVHMR